MGKGETRPDLVRQPDARGPSLREVVEDRKKWVEARMLSGTPDAHIDREGSAKFGLTRQQMYRYRMAVERDWPLVNDDAERNRRQRRHFARIEWGINRSVRNERLARKGGDIAAANGAIRTVSVILQHEAKVLGFNAAIKIEHTSADPVSKMTAEERRERALRALKRRSAQLVPMAATGEGETH